MNCRICQNEMDAYLKGQLSAEKRSMVETHMGQCRDCAEIYRLSVLANLVISGEKEVSSNPFLVTRVMAGIENSDLRDGQITRIPMYHHLVRSVIITSSLAAAILIGVLIGNFYLPSVPGRQLPAELVYLDDASLESVDMFSLD